MQSSDAIVVLIVEDEPLVRMLGNDVLTEAGFRVIEAVNATEALVLLEARPDIMVVVSDVELKGENGLELARIVRQRWPRVGVILCSGRAFPAPGDLPIAAVFLGKPYSLATLVEQVKVMAERAAEPIMILGDGSAEPSTEEHGLLDNVVPLRRGGEAE
jgi:two-component system, response regulator PdtaR